MIVVNLAGGPGSGKTTLAYYLTYRFKVAGLRAEFVGEAARLDHIYDSTPGVVPPPLLDNQPLIAGQQYERIKRLARHGIEVAVSDSAIVMGILYCTTPMHKQLLEPMLHHMMREFNSVDIFVNRRPGTYDAESRVQKDEAEAAAFDAKVRSLHHWDMETSWGQESQLADQLVSWFVHRGLGKLPTPPPRAPQV